MRGLNSVNLTNSLTTPVTDDSSSQPLCSSPSRRHADVEKHPPAIRSLTRANQRAGRRRLIKIARTRFGGIAAATVGRFSTIRLILSLTLSPSQQLLSLSLSLSLYCRSFLRIPRLTIFLVVLSLSLSVSSLSAPAVPAPSARPRLAGPFGVVYAPGIQMTAFARPEECPTISARLRSTTTRLLRGIQPLVSRFFSSSPPSCPRDML